MRQVWQALDGELFEEEQWCKEYEELLEKALKAIEPIKFRTLLSNIPLRLSIKLGLTS